MPGTAVSGPGGAPPTALARLAVVLAGVAVALLALATAGLGGAGVGVVVSLIAFVMALVARIRHERWEPLWLPLLLGPAIAVTSPFWV